MLDNDTKYAIIKGIATGSRFFAIREPHCREFVFGAETGNDDYRMQFIIHPFDDSKHPTVAIKAELDASKFLSQSITTNTECLQSNLPLECDVSKECYTDQLSTIVSDIANGEMEKVVLSYPLNFHQQTQTEHWAKIVERLDEAYPNACIFIYHTDETGFWLGATPEVLGKYGEGKFRTMALAGTKPYGQNREWTEKEVHEQRIVTDFITDRIASTGMIPITGQTETYVAGPVEHLRTLISCECSFNQASKLIGQLHPTPALGGFPQEKAVEYIGSLEKHDRKCYGGYIGLTDDKTKFNFYVNLRSLQFNLRHYTIYVGGGITFASSASDEYNEILTKSKTLLNVINSVLDKH